MQPIGHTVWAIAGGHIPLRSHGHEPDFTSFDRIALLNTSAQEASIEITIYYADREPVGPYPLKVAPRRLRKVRFNDLIDPFAIPLDVDYAALIQSDVPVVVQFQRQDTSREAKAIMGSVAYAAAGR
jgi:hypothetical protein